MQILDVIENAQSGRAMANLAATFGISEDEARAVTEAALPHLAVALERNTLSRGGLADIVRALGDGHHEAILERPDTWSDPRVAADGAAILAHILGSDHKGRTLAARTSRATGIGGGIIEALLPILAQLLMGAISKYMRGGLGDVLSKLPIPGSPGGTGTSHDTGGTMPDRRSPGGFDLPRDELPPAGGFPMPPMPSDGPFSQRRDDSRSSPGDFDLPAPTNGRDATTGTAPPPAGGYRLPRYEVPGSEGSSETGGNWGTPGGDTGGFPLPLPGRNPPQDNPYGDLSDILRRRGNAPAPDGGGSLWSVVRNGLGGLLGFGGSGLFGWLVRLAVLKLGWPLLRRVIFGR